MKKLSITFGTILLVLGCFALSPAAKADPRPTPHPRAFGPPIVGLWQVDYSSVACDQPVLPPEFFTYQQFHRTGWRLKAPCSHRANAKGFGNRRHPIRSASTTWGGPPVASPVFHRSYDSCSRKHLPSASTAIVSTGMLIKRFTMRLSAETSSRTARLQLMPRAFLRSSNREVD